MALLRLLRSWIARSLAPRSAASPGLRSAVGSHVVSSDVTGSSLERTPSGCRFCFFPHPSRPIFSPSSSIPLEAPSAASTPEHSIPDRASVHIVNAALNRELPELLGRYARTQTAAAHSILRYLDERVANTARHKRVLVDLGTELDNYVTR